MQKIVRRARQFARNESGATAIEYGVMVAMIAVGSIVAFTLLGNSISGLFGDNANSGAGAEIQAAAESLG